MTEMTKLTTFDSTALTHLQCMSHPKGSDNSHAIYVCSEASPQSERVQPSPSASKHIGGHKWGHLGSGAWVKTNDY
jgi:hypothetical protein